MSSPPSILLPEEPALVIGLTGPFWLDPTGEIAESTAAEAVARIAQGARPILCHAPTVAQTIGADKPFACYDVLELFAFAHPQRFCIPTPEGIAAAIGLKAGPDPAEAALTLVEVANCLLEEIATLGGGSGAGDASTRDTGTGDDDAVAIARSMAWGGWPWGPAVLAALGVEAIRDGGETRDTGETKGDHSDPQTPGIGGLRFWRNLPHWSHPVLPKPPEDAQPVTPEEARERLAGALDATAEARPGQSDYAAAVTPAFAPEGVDGPHIVLAEAGTGIGKTLGYLAPASLWAQQNRRPVWLSTYSRNLQHQLDQEAAQIYPDPEERRRRVVVRKGRENYLCLLNYEDAVNAAATRPKDAVGLGLLARWGTGTRSGELTGGDFPAWLTDLFGRRLTLGLAIRQGECLHQACPHYSTCYIERNVREAVQADLVIANHALILSQAARSMGGEQDVPPRIVFDEGHHVFDAADSAFARALNGRELGYFRRWIHGPKDARRGLARGLRVQLEPLLPTREGKDSEIENALASLLPEASRLNAYTTLDQIVSQADFLPEEGWLLRCAGGKPKNSAERFLAAVRNVVYARQDQHEDGGYSIECAIESPPQALLDTAGDLIDDLETLRTAIEKLHGIFAGFIEQLAKDESSELPADIHGPALARNRLLAACRTLRRGGTEPILNWLSMLAAITDSAEESFVDWLSIERQGGQDRDFCLHRHWLDPSEPFARFVAQPSQGVLVTSATLRDNGGEEEEDWQAVEQRIGTVHLPAVTPERIALPSPFDYNAQTRIIVVNDVDRNNAEEIAMAYRVLFKASGGGALGLFTAIRRLRTTYDLIAKPLGRAGLKVRAQHVDALNTATLTDIFRAEKDSCLLGSNALRDGIDVPGESLRLIVFDRVPWPAPSVLHSARREAFGGGRYNDAMTRLRLRQAYGRLIRRADDRGVFVLLDSRLPTRLERAFGVEGKIPRLGLEDAAAEVAAFLGRPPIGPGADGEIEGEVEGSE